jgi:cytochrome c-type biogenesis protein CcmH/NrfG
MPVSKQDINPDIGQLKFLCEAGQFLASKGRYAEASDVLQGVIALSPKRAIGYTLLGDVYLNWEKYDDALTAHQKAVKVDPENTFARVHLAEALLFKKQKDKAMQELRAVVEQDPKGSDGALARNLIKAVEQGVFTKVK